MRPACYSYVQMFNDEPLLKKDQFKLNVKNDRQAYLTDVNQN
jgi:hypothetical protein